MASTPLDPAFERAAGIPEMRSLLVSRAGSTIREEHFHGVGSELFHDVKSVTKSVRSALVGIAIERGAIPGVDTPIGETLGSLLDGRDERIGRTTLAELLTMRAGLAWDVYAESQFWDWVLDRDSLDYVLSRPMAEAPGTRFNYSDGAAHLVAVVLSESTGRSAIDLVRAWLLEPLGIADRQHWWADARGYCFGGVGLHLRPRDLLAFGELFLRRGTHGSHQVLPANWVEASTSRQVGLADGVPVRHTDDGIEYGGAYGYYWWHGRAGAHDFHFAKGLGGQYVVIAPGLELVVVSTCDHQRVEPARAYRNDVEVLDLIVRQILPFAAAGSELSDSGSE